MHRALQAPAVLVLLGAAAGCAAPRVAVPVAAGAPALADANARLAGRSAFVVLRDGARLPAYGVRLGPDTTRWRARPSGPARAEATARVQAVEAAVFREPAVDRPGFVLGAAAAVTLAQVVNVLLGDGGRVSPADAGVGLAAGALGGWVGVRLQGRRGRADRRVGRFVLEPTP